jgi:hypothetical protein
MGILLSSTSVSGQKDLVLGFNVVCIIICIVLGGLWTNIAMDYRGSNESEYFRPIIAATVYIFFTFFILINFNIQFFSYVDNDGTKRLLYSLRFICLVEREKIK